MNEETYQSLIYALFYWGGAAAGIIVTWALFL